MTPKQFENKLLQWLPFFVVALIFGYLSYFSQDSYGGGDDLHHYRISRYAFQNPSFFFDLWGKPVFTFLSAPFSQFGYNGTRFYNLMAALLTVFFTWKLVSSKGMKNAWMIVPFIFFAPVYASMIPSAMTEITGSMFLALALMLYFRKQFLLAAIIISFLPFARIEGLFILPLFGLMFLIRKQWTAIPFLLTGVLVYTVIGGFFSGDFLWLLHKFPYSSKSAGIYGSGSLLYYIDRSKLIWGIPLTLLFIVGLLKLIFDFAKTKFSKANQLLDDFVLIFLPILVIVSFHSITWFLGSGALALDRFMAMVVPPFVVLSLSGYNFFEKHITFGKKWAAVSFKIIILVFVVRTTFLMYQLPVPISAEKDAISQACKYILDNKLDDRMIYYYDPNVFFILDIDPTDDSRIREAIPDFLNPGNEMIHGSILFWDSHFSPGQGNLPLERILENENFKSLGVFKPSPDSGERESNYMVYLFEFN
ncbi:MAG: hypothetical protein KG029_07275 [Bacteroidetes bacterium]|nr:hypothetical protein [Bacteroidota bacterium]